MTDRHCNSSSLQTDTQTYQHTDRQTNRQSGQVPDDSEVVVNQSQGHSDEWLTDIVIARLYTQTHRRINTQTDRHTKPSELWLMSHITSSQLSYVIITFLPSARQHLSYGDCLEVKREYYQNSSVLDCVTQCSQFAAHLREQFLQVK